MVDFLVTEKGFNEDRVRKQADKLKIALTQKQQGRLDGFFKPMPKAEGSSSPAKKRKVHRPREQNDMEMLMLLIRLKTTRQRKRTQRKLKAKKSLK